MMWSLPYSVTIDGVEHKIRNRCDYRVVLDVIRVLNANDLDEEQKLQCALFIFYDDSRKIKNAREAVEQMYSVINCGEQKDERPHPKVMDWEQDFPIVAPAVGKTLGYEVRDPDRYTHWWTFVGGYREISDSVFNTVLQIRSKRAKGKKLEKWEQEFFNENRNLVILKQTLTKEQLDFLQGGD